MNRPLTATALLAATLLTGCAADPAPGPPDIRFGRDLCLHCGMVIVDERAAAALQLDGPAPDQPPVFDDVGCLIDHLAAAPASSSARAWVKDHDTRAWLPASDATYALSDDIETPMGSGLAAFASPEAARAAAPAGEILTYRQLPDRRLRWRHDRFGTPLK